MSFVNIMIVGVGGFLGTIARYWAVRSIDQRFNAVFPYGTITVNILGSFILGFVMALLMRKTGVADHWKLFLGTGFCGGFTTFSAFAWENVSLLNQKMLPISLLYVGLSLVLGLLAVAFGVWVSRFL